MWSRRDDGTIFVEAAFDFGILPLTTPSKNAFAAPGVGLLPPVAFDMWQRFTPVPVEVMKVMNIYSGYNQMLLQASNWVVHHEPYELYPGQVPPVLEITPDRLQTTLEVRGAVPITAEDIGSLNINLNAVFQKAFLLSRS